MTRVSVIVPAWRAGAVLGRALASVAQCGWPEEDVEIVVAPDDGAAYDAFADGWATRVVLPPGPVASGPGPARNRALAAATGDVVAFLDADDSWAPGYLAGTVPLALGHGVAFGPTQVMDGGATLMRLPAGPWLGLKELGRGASFHPVLRRALAGPFAASPAQDAFHAVEVVALAGGRAPLGPAAYRLHLNPVSTTARDGYGEIVGAAYASYATTIRAGASRVPEALRAEAAKAFDRRIAVNRTYMADASHARFYDFLAARGACRVCPPI